ncbi:hypothetical protein SY27_07730 [Flavobacterium sp. 316]|nr:hypothetical protein SY27_07730 [Flavobacterium sp. 316]
MSETDNLKYNDDEVIQTKKVKEYKGIIFFFYHNRLEIIFKFHYYFNNSQHNANDFSVIDCINVVKEFRDIFDIDLSLLAVINLEFGVNFLSPIRAIYLISYMIYHDKNAFRNDAGLSYSIRSFKDRKDGTANKYKTIKAYIKSLQFPKYCEPDTCRFEIASKEAKYIKQLGINSAKDLLNLEVYLKMEEKIKEEFDNVLILDCETDFTSLTDIEQRKIADYNNPLKWFHILNNPYRNHFSKQKEIYYKFVNKIENNLRNQLIKIISDKLDFLKRGAISTTPKV